MPNVRFILPWLICGVLSLAACNQNTSPPSGAEPSPPLTAGPAVRNLLGGLKAGDPLGPLVVMEIYAPTEGRVQIAVEKDKAIGRIEIALNGEGPLPPVQTGKYSIFWTGAASEPSLPNNLLEEACNVLAEKIKATENDVPMPSGMTPYGKVVTAM